MIQATIKMIKSKEKSNISASISTNQDGSFKSWNFTGKLTSLEGYVTKDGVNFDSELVAIDCATTALIFNEQQGEAIYQRAAEIFEQREAEGDPNPAVDLVLTVKTVRPKETNILLVNVKQAFLDADTQIVDNSETVENVIAKLKANSAAKAKPQVSAARAGLGNALQRSMQRIAKTYL